MKLTSSQLEEVIDILLEKFPNKLPGGVTGSDFFHILIGQQQVINHLMALHEAQEERNNGKS